MSAAETRLTEFGDRLQGVADELERRIAAVSYYPLTRDALRMLADVLNCMAMEMKVTQREVK